MKAWLETFERTIDPDGFTRRRIRARSPEAFEARINVHRFVSEFLRDYSPDAAQGYREERPSVWVYWAQGRESMPPIVRVCFERLVALHDNVKLLTDATLSDYVRIPSGVFAKTHVNKTHFSDILRVCLLAQHGGIWIDATCYCAHSVMPMYEHAKGSAFFAYTRTDTFMLSSWFMAAEAGARIPTMLRDALFAYWLRNDHLEDYFLIHFVFEALYNFDEAFRAIWNRRLVLSATEPHALQDRLLQPYSQEEWDHLMTLASVHKLTYKLSETERSQGTFWHHLVNQ